MDPRPLNDPVTSSRKEPLLDDLVHWDEIPPERLAALERDSHARARLALLRRMEELLEAPLAPDGPCPPAEDLYDYGRGPGYEPLSLERRHALDLHVDRCDECSALVRSLAASPPLPLDVSPPLEDRPQRPSVTGAPAKAPFGSLTSREEVAGPFAVDGGRRPAPSATREWRHAHAEDPFAEGRAEQPAREPLGRSSLGPYWSNEEAVAGARRRRLPRLAPWIAGAAAASLLFIFWPDRQASAPLAPDLSWPTAPVLRGASGGPLFFPRGQILAVPLEAGAARGRNFYSESPVFELEAVPSASLYRISLRRYDGGAFDEGHEINYAESSVPRLVAQIALTPGFYSWEAWVTVNGLDRQLGPRDFEVVRDDELCRELDRLDDLSALRLLHARGFLTDARHLAESMPPSPERDRYLRELPGR